MLSILTCQVRAIFLTVLECATDEIDVGTEFCAFFVHLRMREQERKNIMMFSPTGTPAQIMNKNEALVGPKPVTD
jgi:hypothetical protein